MQNMSTLRSPGRGRPAARLQRHVVDDLMAATEHVLAVKTAKEVTVREISTAAGTSEAMIRYYFGSKEGLLLAVIENFMEDSPHKNGPALARSCIAAKSIRPLASALFEFHYERPNLIRMIVVELLSSSSDLKEVYLSRYGYRITNLSEGVVNAMKEAHVYRADLNARFAATTLVRLTVAPIMESAVIGAPQTPPEVRSGEWIEFIASTIDSIAV